MTVEDPSPRAASKGRAIVLLMSGGPMAWSVANDLHHRLGPITVIEEQPEGKWLILRRRGRMLGWPTAIGQALCGVLLKGVAAMSRSRQRAILEAGKLDPRPNPAITVHGVTSVNTPECRDLLRQLSPDAVAVYGTRIIKPDTLAAVDRPFINYHAGINPKYRGQQPGYWALVAGDRENAGVTIHRVDRGVDTGDVLYQSRVDFDPKDNITTYQWQQMTVAMPLLARAIDDALTHQLKPTKVDLPSRQHFPPTIWGYLWTGVTRSVW